MSAIDRSFLNIYNEELRFLRESGHAFSAQHPAVASALGLEKGAKADPIVERIIESFAFLTARVQQRLDLEQVEVAYQLLQRVSPLWNTETPVMTSISFEPDLTYPSWNRNVVIPRGSKIQIKSKSNNRIAYFTTGQDVQINPLLIERAEFTPHLPHLPIDLGVQDRGNAFLRLKFSTRNIINISDLNIEKLRITLTDDAIHGNRVIQQLLLHTQSILLWCDKKDGSHDSDVLPQSQLAVAGLCDNEALLPVQKAEIPGMRLMREYFAFPEKFLGFTISGVSDFLKRQTHEFSFELIFVLSHVDTHLMGSISASDFSLYSTPLINLYKRRCAPIVVDPDRTDQQVIVDRSKPDDYRIFCLEKVGCQTHSGESIEVEPLGGVAKFNKQEAKFLYSFRTEPKVSEITTDGEAWSHRDYISLVSDDSEISVDQIKTLFISSYVSDVHVEDLAEVPKEYTFEASYPITKVRLIRPFSHFRPRPGRGKMWSAIRQNSDSLLRLSPYAEEDITVRMKEWLLLFSSSQSGADRRRINSIEKAVLSPKILITNVNGISASLRGYHLTVDIDEVGHSDFGAFVFAELLRHALFGFCDLNQCVEMSLYFSGNHVRDWGPITHVC